MKYFNYLQRLLFFPREREREQGKTYWEQLVFVFFALILIPGGAYLSISGALMFIKEEQPFFAFLNIFFYGASLLFLLVKKIPFTLRKRGVLYIISLTGLSLLVTTGPYGAGLIFLIVGMVVAGLFESRRALVIHSLVISAALAIITVFLFSGLLNTLPIAALKNSWWIVISNLLVVGILTSIVVQQVTIGLTRQSILASEKEQDITTIYESIQDPIIIFGSDYIIYRCNPAAEQLLGMDEKDMQGQFLYNVFYLHLVQGDSDEEVMPRLLSLLADKDHTRKMKRFYQKLSDGRKRDLLISITPLHTADLKQKNFLLLCKDITFEIESQNQERQKNKMEAIGSLASGIAHDFNNMLGGIMGYTELLLSQITENEEYREHLNQILSACAQATTLIRKLQDFNRASVDNFSIIDLHEVFNSAIGLLSRSIDKSISINLDFGARRAKVLGDSVLLQNALLNICINARDAMPKGGFLNIKTMDIFLTQENIDENNFPLQIQSGEFIEISIKDSGQGISEANQKRIFEPFFTTKLRGKGTGLGLTSVYSMIEKHEGVIRVKSIPEVGTEFIILLPVVKEKEDPGDIKVRETKKNDFKNEFQEIVGKVLLVDDEYIVRDATQAQLQSFGLSVATVNDGYAAIKMFKEIHNTLTVIILDVNMPGIDGIQTLREMRKINDKVPAVIYTGYSDIDIEKEIREVSGYHVLLRKPYTREELYQVIKDLHYPYNRKDRI